MFGNYKKYHFKLIDDMKQANISYNAAGECFGFAAMGMQAILLQDTVSFDRRINKLSEISPTDISIKINSLDTLDVSERQFWVDAQAFLTDIALYQIPSAFRHVFNGIVNQGVKKISEIVMPLALKNQGGMKKISSFSGVYSQDELNQLLQSLRQDLIASGINFPVALMLSSSRHSITLGYYPDFDYWLYIDINDAPTKFIKPSVIASKVNQAFSDTSTTGLSFNVYTKGVNAYIAMQVIVDWMCKNDFINLQKITPERVRLTDSSGASLLAFAVDTRDTFKIRDILHLYHDNITAMTSSGATALHFAALKGYGAGLRLMLKYPNLDVNLRMQPKGITALELAINSGDAECVRLLLNYPGIRYNEEHVNLTPLYRAVLLNRVSCVAELLKMDDININHFSSSGMTPLILAIVLNYTRCAEMLLNHPKLNIECCNADGDCALNKAVACNNLEFVRKILEKFPNSIHQIVNGKTALEIAEDCKLEEIAEFIRNFINSQPACASLHSHADTPAQTHETAQHSISMSAFRSQP